jgi:hypothetical protein
MANVLIHTATGAVISWGAQAFTPGAGQSVVQAEGESFPDGAFNKYVKVAGGVFVAMTAPERAAVDAVFAVRKILRVSRAAEFTVTTGQADAGAGWASVFSAPLQSPPLEAGAYQLSVSFELSLLAPAVWGAGGPNTSAQARLMMNGAEIASWISPFDQYARQTAVFSSSMAAGDAPLFDFQVRRFGAAATARARRVQLTITPLGTPDIDAT